MVVKLESFLQEINEKTTSNNQFPVLTSSKAGLYLQSGYFNKQVASKDNTGYKIIRRGQFTYRAMSDTGEFFPNMLECADVGIVSPAYPVFKISDPNVIIPEYLKYFFKSSSFQHSISSFAQGSTRTSIKFGKMKTVSINLPVVKEQIKIVDALDRANRIIADRESMIQHLDDLIKARFVEMFGDVVTNPKGYRKENIGKVCLSVADGSHNPPKSSSISNYLMLSSKNVIDDRLTLDDPRYITKEQFEVEHKRTNAEPGDILLTIVGTIGRSAIIPDNASKIAFQRSVAVLKPNREKVLPVFLKYQLDNIRHLLEKEAHGIAQLGVYLTQVRDMEVITPSLEEQLKFSAFVKQVDKSKVVVQKALDEAQLLFDSLMQKYFE